MISRKESGKCLGDDNSLYNVYTQCLLHYHKSKKESGLDTAIAIKLANSLGISVYDAGHVKYLLTLESGKETSLKNGFSVAFLSGHCIVILKGKAKNPFSTVQLLEKLRNLDSSYVPPCKPPVLIKKFVVNKTKAVVGKDYCKTSAVRVGVNKAKIESEVFYYLRKGILPNGLELSHDYAEIVKMAGYVYLHKKKLSPSLEIMPK